MNSFQTSCDLLSKLALPEELPGGYSLRRLTGDASSRSYFRIQIPGDHTVILMKMPEPFGADKFPYLENYYLFRSLGVRLAEIYSMNPSRGLVFLQDDPSERPTNCSALALMAASPLVGAGSVLLPACPSDSEPFLRSI